MQNHFVYWAETVGPVEVREMRMRAFQLFDPGVESFRE